MRHKVNYELRIMNYEFRFHHLPAGRQVSLCFVTSFLEMTILLIGKTKLLSLRA